MIYHPILEIEHIIKIYFTSFLSQKIIQYFLDDYKQIRLKSWNSINQQIIEENIEKNIEKYKKI